MLQVAIFQRIMEGLLRDIPGVVVYLDDILITGRTDEEHLAALQTVLARLEQAGLRLQRKKCNFIVSSVEYLGHRIDSKGLNPTEEKLRAVKDAPRPKNVSELKAFLGMLSYYSMQVLAKHVNGSGTTVSPAEAKCEMEVVSCGRRGISFCQGTSDVVTGTGALRPTARLSHDV